VRVFYDHFKNALGWIPIWDYITSNADETIVINATVSRKLLYLVNKKTILRPRPSKYDHIMMLLCCSAIGVHNQSLVVLPLTNHPTDLDIVEQFYHIYVGNNSGWMNEVNLTWWIENCSYPQFFKLGIKLNTHSNPILIADEYLSANDLDTR
jgi:hypothetical protein